LLNDPFGTFAYNFCFILRNIWTCFRSY